MPTTILQRRYLLAGLATLGVLGRMGALRAQIAPASFSPEQLDQMLAPIALYPDALLSQVLMAATYPLEVVEAARWSRANLGLRGNDAVNAVTNEDWDVSVKSLVAFPQVLAEMDQHLDWTQNLGDAMLAQQGDVSDSIQRLRARAADAGRLASVPNETIQYIGTGADRMIVIAPADPAVIYVPYYDPAWAYGAWPYPAYPPFYYRPLPAYGYVLASGFMFGIGIAASIALFGGWHWGRGSWGRGAGYIHVDPDRVVHIDRHFDPRRVNDSHGAWQHDADHRHGVAYRDAATRERFRPRGGVDQRQQFRGRPEGAPTGRHPGNSPPQTTHVQNTGRPEPPRQPPPTNSPTHAQLQTHQAPSGSHSAISGVERGTQVNHESARGNQQVQRLAQHSSPPQPQARPSPPPHPAATPHPASPPPKDQKK